MKTYIKYKIMAFLTVVILMPSCESNFLDINKDPNNPLDVPLKQLLPSAQLNIAYAFGNSSGGLNGYVGTIMHHYTQRGDINDYGLQGTDFSITVPWTSLYAGALTDLDRIIKKADKEKSKHYTAVAKILKALTYVTLVDLWGDVPYSEATLGTKNLAPKYESGEKIYEAMHQLLDEAISETAAESKFSPGNDDLFYGKIKGIKTMDAWRKLAKTLKLRMYNNVRLVQDVNSQITSLINENDFITQATDFQMNYGTSISPENRNPGYRQEWSKGGANYYISPYFYEIMRSQNTFAHGGIQFGEQDPRIPYYFFNQLKNGAKNSDAENPCAYCPSKAGSSFLSIYSFSYNIDPNEGFDQGKSQTVAGLYPLGGAYNNGQGGVVSNASTLQKGEVSGPATIPQRIITYSELLYIKAELAQAGIVGDATAEITNAINASFAKVNQIATSAKAPPIANTAIDKYRNAITTKFTAANATEKMDIIITQKWIDSFGNAIVSYNDHRKLGLPRLHDGNTDNLSVTVRTRDFPVSLPYHTTNLELNKNAPTQRNITSDKVFWDK